MSRQSVDSGKMSVPSVATDRNGQTFMSRQARGITMIEYMSRQAGDHPRSGRRDNSFMSRRPYAGVAPAQPGPTLVASTSTSAGAASGCTICVWSRLRELANCQRAADKERLLMASRHQILSSSPKYGQLPELDSEDSMASRHQGRSLRAHPPIPGDSLIATPVPAAVTTLSCHDGHTQG
jgi:hypothetical protein